MSTAVNTALIKNNNMWKCLSITIEINSAYEYASELTKYFFLLEKKTTSLSEINT